MPKCHIVGYLMSRLISVNCMTNTLDSKSQLKQTYRRTHMQISYLFICVLRGIPVAKLSPHYIKAEFKNLDNS